MQATGNKAIGFDLLIQYLVEKEQAEVIHNDEAMMIYKVEGDSIHISNAITKKGSRQKGKARDLLNYLNDVIAKKHEANFITCNVDLNQQNPELSMKSVLGTGFKIIPTHSQAYDIRMQPNIVQFYKEVNNG